LINNCVTAFKLKKFVPSDSHTYDELFRTIDQHEKVRSIRSKDVSKVLFKERISGKSISDGGVAAPYLDYNAHTRGDFDLQGLISIASQCQKSVVWLEGEKSDKDYLKTIHCRKQWCPVCGGKGGVVHKSRINSILKRVDVDKYNLRQLVLTLPDSIWSKMESRENLSLLFVYAKQLVEKFFGVPVFDKKGHVKRYVLENGVISYLHLFGDEQHGILKPHINLHILENSNIKLKLDQAFINSIKKYWLKKLKLFDETLAIADVHYKFRIQKAHKLHAIKYMTKPWSCEDFEAIKNDDLKKLLVVDMSGFRYLRFWGSVSNCSYRDDMDISEIKNECESIIDEKLIVKFVAPFNFKSWENRLIKIDDGFYEVRSKNEQSEIAERKREIWNRFEEPKS